MPLYKKFSDHKDNHLVIWEIKEGKQELVSALKQDSSYSLKLSSIKSETKQIEFLSILKLLEELNLTFKDLSYNEFGKPTLQKTIHFNNPFFSIFWNLLFKKKNWN